MSFEKPTALPAFTLTTSLTTYIQVSCMLDNLSITNNDTVDRTVTIKDGAGKVFEPALTVIAGTRYQLPLSQDGQPLQQSFFFAGGLVMSGEVANKLDVFLAARTN